jgi:1-acyl-sn-glycerol-3-phosphate acyltransferase
MTLWPYTWGRLFRFLALPVDLVYRLAITRTTVLGAEHVRRSPERLILAGTHRSFADLPLVRRGLAASGRGGLARRLVVAAGADGFAKAGLYGRWAVLALGLYPLRRGEQREASLRDLRTLGEQHPLLIFPQGRHARPEEERADDRVARFRPGVAHLAVALDAAVVPFGLAGTERVMPPTLEGFDGPVIAGIPLSLRRGPVAIAFGEPMRPAAGESPRAFAARLQAASFALTRQAEQALAA